MLIARGLAVTVSSFVVSGALTLGALWPLSTMADDQASPFAVLVDPGTKVGEHVRVEGKAERDAKSSTGWVVVMKAENKGTATETVALETRLQRTVSNPMARVPAMPMTAWQTKETLTLAKGEVVTRRYVVPADVAQAMTAAAAPAAAASAKKGKTALMTARTSFGVVFAKVDALGT